MNIICIDSFEDATLTNIFCSILDWHFAKGFDENIQRLTKMIVAATMDVYKRAIATFLPTPMKSHYTFSLRDFSRVIRGIMLVPSSRLKDPDKLIRLWIHETYRVFDDRLINNEDKYVLTIWCVFNECCPVRDAFFNIVHEATYQNYRQHMDKMCACLLEEDGMLNREHIRNLFFGNYIEPDADPKFYDEVTRLTK